MQIVKFLRRFGISNPGEIVGLDADDAAKLAEIGVVETHKPPDVASPKPKKQTSE